MNPAPNGEGLSTRTLVLFLSLGVVLVILGVTDFDEGKFFVLVGVVVTVFNGVALSRRWASRPR